MTPRYAIGQQFMSRGKFPRLCTVTDILTTTNSNGVVVKIRYVAEHEFLNQIVTDSDVSDTAISMGFVAQLQTPRQGV
jgi:hypothetical protein